MRCGFPILLVLAGCAEMGLSPATAPPAADAAAPAVAAPPPPRDARTADEFDTTTESQRIAATAAAETGSDRFLGETVATLGDPSDPGFWLRTPLVDTVRPGRVTGPTGISGQVELRPSGGPASAGSEASLALMRLLEVPLTGLPVLKVHATR